MVFKKFTGLILELLFPKFCFGCQREGSYLCEDCRSTLEISEFHKQHSGQYLKDLYFALPYQNPLIKSLIQKFKYQPLVKELAESLSLLIIEHFQLLDNKLNFTDFTIIPIPLEKRRLKSRGFNQAEEIAKELSHFLEIPLFSGCLIKTKETTPQVELSGDERKENIRGAFSVKNSQEIKNKKILLVDDVFTTGSTMEEAARILKAAGAKEIIGIVIARASPGEDRP
ncbi:MAG TPA: ComF family protein [Candidatus Humimicrobiaceae bacterium]|nr:ComF family protein [Candidatus Humimicrobiaceae bacterium]